MRAWYDDKGAGTLHIEYDSVTDMMATAAKSRDKKLLDGNVHLRCEVAYHNDCFNEPNKWNGRHTLEMVEKELRRPTPKMAAVIDSGETLFDCDDFSVAKPRRRVCRRLEDGDEIDVERWIDREPDMWEEVRKSPSVRYGVRIGVNCAISGTYGAEAFKWRTSTVVAILRICEELQIPCEVVGYKSNSEAVRAPHGKKANVKLSFMVKRPEHLLDIDKLGYCLGSQGFYRCGVLGAFVVETSLFHNDGGDGKDCWSPDSGLGTPDDVKDVEPNEFVLDRGCLNEENARGEVARFRDWLQNYRRRAAINLDGLDTEVA